MLVLAKRDNAIHERLTADLADVEARFAAELRSDLDCVNELVEHVERYRGKMLRPTLVLVSALASHPDQPTEPTTRPGHRIVATVLEMVHMATLVHDDILDEAELRRRGATINHLAGNEAAVMLGDYLISHAYHLCSSLGDAEISRAIAHATNTVCEGELLQLANRNNADLDERTYFEIIRRKTASLCGVSCRLAAVLNNTPPATTDALYHYGEKLGVAFQIVDDVLDLTGDERTVGKTLNRDLEKGKLTLPLIHHLASLDDTNREAMRELLEAQRDRSLDPAVRDKQAKLLRDRLNADGSVEFARQRAAELVASAKAQISEHLPESPARTLLLEMADAVLSRKF
ncbi:polyprenyl synthetase family protein [Phycisphaerales bacterium AB-hyl4]|uniref:Polyprenyl synthetase family protein n=1 Tax=Natronomicrosphaera hydrolytica TaxID=3242702 RepID=A0ABV4U783_9BACT